MVVIPLILIALAATAALRVVADRWHLPHPVLLVLGGLVLAITPGLPRIVIQPEVIFLIFVPPLLYLAAYLTSWRDFRRTLRSILLGAVGLVLVTMIGVAAVAHSMLGFAWPAAFVLGAIVSSTDGVAMTAVTRRLSVRPEISTVLEGESLVNDAVAFVAYRFAVAAAVTNQFSLSHAAVQFAVGAAGGIATGLVIGVVAVWLRRRLSDLPEVDGTISLLMPFAAFMPSDRLGFSGLLAVVALGIYVSREAPRAVAPATRLNARDLWNVLGFVLEGLIFILIGLGLPLVLQTIGQTPITTLIWDGLAISGAVIVVRILWVLTIGPLRQRLERALHRTSVTFSIRESFFIGWAGSRGAYSLVIALALPLTIAAGGPFPERGTIIFITFVVIFVTLVVKGFTLRPLIKALGLGGHGRDEEESVEARLRTAKAGLARLDEIIASEPALVEAAAWLKSQHRHRVRQYVGRRRHELHRRDESRADDYVRVRLSMLEAELNELIRLRDNSVIGDEVLREIERELDLEQVLLRSNQPPQPLIPHF